VFLSKGSKYAMILDPSLFKICETPKYQRESSIFFKMGGVFFLVCVLNENFALFYVENKRIFGVFFVIF
jgi:hypothetical protein